MPGGVQKVGDWQKAAKILNGLAGRFHRALIVGLSRTGQMMRDETRKGIRAQAPGGQPFEPLSEFTIANKGSSKALIDDGDLINSITFKVNPEQLSVFVGILRTATSKNEGSGETYLTNIARVHEEGALIPVTPKMRAYFRHRWGINLKASTTHITIPARPFIKPTFEKYAPRAQERFREAVDKVLRGEKM